MKANRIQELAEQATIKVPHVECGYLINHVNLEKFAELIIADCAKLCEPAAQVEPFNPDWASYRQGKLDGAAEALAHLAQPERPPNARTFDDYGNKIV